MDCAVCQSPVDVDATRCVACGASIYEDDDAATVAGPRFADMGTLVPLGEVLAERWELEARLGTEGPFVRFRAIDQESDARVCVTVFARELLQGTAERDAVRERLASCVGLGNRYVPGLLDVDRERTLLFVVEPLVAGPTLRSVLDARRGRGESMQVSEVLPVVAQLAAALAGLPPPHRHGDVRAERVVVGREGLRLVLPFVLPALPGPVRARLLAPDDTWRRALAPEELRGTASDAADRFGVAAIALEALTGAAPGGPFPSLRPDLAPVEDALRELLAADPSSRPVSLAALVEALAECAHLPVPDLDPGPFRRVRRSGAPRSSAGASVGPPAPEASGIALSGADTTLRTAALDAAGLVADAHEPSQVLVDTKESDIFEAGLTEAAEPATTVAPRAAIPGLADLRGVVAPLVKDALPSAYRLDEGPTLAERARTTRRVVAVSEQNAPAVLAGSGAAAGLSGASAAGSPEPSAPARRRAVAGAAPGGTQEISMDEVFESRADAGVASGTGLDPRLLRAARAPRESASRSAATTTRENPSAAPKSRGGDTQQLSAADLAEMRGEAAARGASPSSSPPASHVPARADAAHLAAPAPRSRAPLPSLHRSSPPGPIAGTVPLPADAVRPLREPTTVDTPAEEPPTVAIAPPASRLQRLAPVAGPVPSQVVRAHPVPDAPLPGTIPLASRLSSSELPGTAPLAPGALPISHGPTTGAHAQRLRQRAPTMRAEDAAQRPPRGASGRTVLWMSVALALVIVGVGVFIAWRREAAQQHERQRIYQQRIEQVRRQNG